MIEWGRHGANKTHPLVLRASLRRIRIRRRGVPLQHVFHGVGKGGPRLSSHFTVTRVPLSVGQAWEHRQVALLVTT